mmetsp:Transcript_170208/g.540441  ORF Transcript_170208/g.540441 Transcript_170208/m.540441 type:complete len:129 (-) Transcript_170208:116-502(-)|eukprot:CAMPEP_0204204608 /NCGR_PEP_ID=MMETSP0361-20130328/69750_1 /ASSEMBLY_ACC=CAM_ASM_000343 /TAXON_ID=268821 /ORGANISM="Scrippsiella Hangoei, Strain SHTV-5" /LENGTH=128 /DNA_ID=CAMNT_0051167739 /DNA_START=65 /DNA_END=451 /DNA_ORIENTATION=-
MFITNPECALWKECAKREQRCAAVATQKRRSMSSSSLAVPPRGCQAVEANDLRKFSTWRSSIAALPHLGPPAPLPEGWAERSFGTSFASSSKAPMKKSASDFNRTVCVATTRCPSVFSKWADRPKPPS